MKIFKKILIGFFFGLIFVLFWIGKAGAEGYCSYLPNPECFTDIGPVVDCPVLSEEECKAHSDCCRWVTNGEGGEGGGGGGGGGGGCAGGGNTIWDFLNQICGSCGINIICWIECILGYIITLFFRLPLFFFGLLGLALAALLILIGDQIIVPIVAQLMDLSLTTLIYDKVKDTWESVRNFSLELVGIFLAIIGLATIFRFVPYHARKFFVSLCVAAILVNFSFAICKELILVANDFTATIGNYFKVGIITTQVGGVESGVKSSLGDFKDVFDTLWKTLFEQFFPNIWRIFTIDGSIPAFFTTAESLGQPKVTGPILIIIALIATSFWIFAFLCLYVIVVLAAFGIVFLIRMVFLAALIAVAPIAFLTAGFATREIKQIFPQFLNWDGWWPAFLEWAFIGVPLLIWLGVGVFLLKDLSAAAPSFAAGECAPPNVGAAMTWASGFILDLFRPFLAVLAFAVALHLGIKSSPGMMRQAVEGIFGVLKLVTGAIAVAVTAAVTAGVGAAAGAAAAGASKLGALGAALKAGALEGGRAFVGSLAKGVPGELKRVEFLKPGVEIAEEVAKPIMPWIKRPFVREREEAEKEAERIYKEKGVKGAEETIKSKYVSDTLKGELLAKLLKEGKLSDELIESKEFQDFLKTKEGSKYLKDVLKLRVDLAPQFVNPETNRPFTPEEILKGMTPKDAVKIRVKALLEPEVVSAMSPEQARAIVRGGGVAQKEAIGKTYAEIIRREANVVLDTSTPERLRDSVVGAFPAIQSTIDRLRRSPHPEDVSRAEMLREIGNAILGRRLTWH